LPSLTGQPNQTLLALALGDRLYKKIGVTIQRKSLKIMLDKVFAQKSKNPKLSEPSIKQP
jgi:hypothetical protein